MAAVSPHVPLSHTTIQLSAEELSRLQADLGISTIAGLAITPLERFLELDWFEVRHAAAVVAFLSVEQEQVRSTGGRPISEVVDRLGNRVPVSRIGLVTSQLARLIESGRLFGENLPVGGFVELVSPERDSRLRIDLLDTLIDGGLMLPPQHFRELNNAELQRLALDVRDWLTQHAIEQDYAVTDFARSHDNRPVPRLYLESSACEVARRVAELLRHEDQEFSIQRWRQSRLSDADKRAAEGQRLADALGVFVAGKQHPLSAVMEAFPTAVTMFDLYRDGPTDLPSLDFVDDSLETARGILNTLRTRAMRNGVETSDARVVDAEHSDLGGLLVRGVMRYGFATIDSDAPLSTVLGPTPATRAFAILASVGETDRPADVAFR